MSKPELVRFSWLRYSHPSLELRPCFHRLHEPRSSCIHTIGCPCLRCSDIAILFDVIVLDWINLIVEFLHLLWDYIYCCYMRVLIFLPLRLSCKESSTFSPSPSSVYHHYSVPTILQVVTRICFRKKLFYYRF